MILNRIQVKGAKELQARLSTLPKKVQGSILRPAMREGLKIIQRAARADAPEKTGRMKRAIRIKSRKGRRGDVVLGVVLGAGFFAGKEFYGGFQEFGWHAGHRRRSVGRIAQKHTARLRSNARARRNTGEGPRQINGLDDLMKAALAKRGTRVRAMQERAYKIAGQEYAKKVGDDRRFVPGKHFMQKASDDFGQAAADTAARLIAAGITRHMTL